MRRTAPYQEASRLAGVCSTGEWRADRAYGIQQQRDATRRQATVEQAMMDVAASR
jgi:hypothetical protein